MTFLVAICFMLLKKMKCVGKQRKHLKSLISGPLTSFSYNELSFATAKFTERIGGGFGMVYKGVLKNGTMVVIKLLENTRQGIDEFLAEVDNIGNIHHVNLVKLINFCIDKRNKKKTRKKIFLDITKGLAYIHDDCRQRIAHLDVKPQNILLDDSFNAKISDFGLSKLINRDKSQVVTQMRGTLGYLAHEWQHSRITVKVDIYRFGIVMLEVITGRMVLDYSQPDSDVCLLKLVKKK
ncbi:hypothetical protein PVK06_015087 [Gossypium arboreum]|uniref:Protein kinase domain-containing protein n=1 Tax=Gossypium arboreum TaxID=29729 RepID=A0ABR0PWY2_GOSAR|nr:hypothetical protein PVK06_015087 [Gossypium arboreum]